jgi:hypothetical protein
MTIMQVYITLLCVFFKLKMFLGAETYRRKHYRKYSCVDCSFYFIT